MNDSINEAYIKNTGLKSLNISKTGEVQFLKRVDSKFIVPARWVKEELIEPIKSNYFIVENNNILFPHYTTWYYDTAGLDMYLQHHNNRPKRFKIRIREYLASGDIFLEIKTRTHSGETLKKRVPLQTERITDHHISNFIEQNTPYRFNALQKILETRFDRITLVSVLFNERVTLDFDVNLKHLINQKNISLNEICVIESKRDKYNKSSAIIDLLKQSGYRKSSFSKYAMGCALLNQGIKINNFKPAINHLKKISDENNVVFA